MNRGIVAALTLLVGAWVACAKPARTDTAAAAPDSARHRPDSTGAAAAAPRPVDSAAAPAPADLAPLTDAEADRSIQARTLGSSRAPITVYEISDFQCPYCRDFVESTLPAVKREFVNTGKLRMIFVNFPIPQLHRNAAAAHEFAMCTADQGKFWAIHDLLYRNQDAWDTLANPATYFFGLADSARVSRGELQQCLARGAARQLVLADMETASRAGVRSTPSFVINGALLAGDVPMKSLRPILDSIYRAATAPH